MSVSRLTIQYIEKLARVSTNEEYTIFLNSVYNESRIFDSACSNDLHSIGFKYTFFLGFKRELSSMRKTKVRSRCLCFGRARAVFVKYKMSRFAFKSFARNGDINGLKKAS